MKSLSLVDKKFIQKKWSESEVKAMDETKQEPNMYRNIL